MRLVVRRKSVQVERQNVTDAGKCVRPAAAMNRSDLPYRVLNQIEEARRDKRPEFTRQRPPSPLAY